MKTPVSYYSHSHIKIPLKYWIDTGVTEPSYIMVLIIVMHYPRPSSLQQKKIHLVQNAGARTLTGIKFISEHITPILSSLHWFPISLRSLSPTKLFMDSTILTPQYLHSPTLNQATTLPLEAEDFHTELHYCGMI